MRLGENYNWAFKYIKTTPKLIVEVGSRDCLDALQLSKFFGCKVIAFEASPVQSKVCKENLRLSNNSQVLLREEALNDENTSLTFWQINQEKYENTGASSLFKVNFANRPQYDPDLNHEPIQDPIEVKGVRWDNLGLGHPDLVALDVEGSELRVLKGFGNELSKISTIILEVSPVSSFVGGCSFNEVNKFLKSFGFSYVASDSMGKGRLRLRCFLTLYWIKARMKKPLGPPTTRGFFNAIYINTKKIEN